MRDHRRLDAFRLADALCLAVYSETRVLPREEVFGLTAQMRRCAVSVPANIAEGSVRRTERDYARFLEIALGSARELGYYVSLCGRLGYLDRKATAALEHLQGRTAAALAALLRTRTSPNA